MKPKPRSDEYRAFENLLGEVLTVTKAELDERLKKEGSQKRTPQPQTVPNDKPAHH